MLNTSEKNLTMGSHVIFFGYDPENSYMLTLTYREKVEIPVEYYGYIILQ